MSAHTFSYIIGYRHKAERLNNLKRVIEWLSGFGGIEIIIVEQDKSPKLQELTLKGIKHIFTKSDMPYNRSWAFNVGVKYATSKIVAFGDSDLIMDPNEIISALKMLDNYDCVSPYKSVLDLQPQESGLPMEHLKLISRPGRGETDNQKINLCGGIVLYRKDSIQKIGGWCEEFIGWGGEDNFQEFKTHNLLTYYECPYKCYHLWHERPAPDQQLYTRTMELLNKLVTMSKEDLLKHINISTSKIGITNKYDK